MDIFIELTKVKATRADGYRYTVPITIRVGAIRSFQPVDADCHENGTVMVMNDGKMFEVTQRYDYVWYAIKSSGGIDAISEPAMSGPQAKTSPMTNSDRPMGRVFCESLVTSSKAKRNSFHDWVKVKSATTASAGNASGMKTVQSACKRLAPSTSAASSRSEGTVLKYEMVNQVENGTEKIR